MNVNIKKLMIKLKLVKENIKRIGKKEGIVIDNVVTDKEYAEGLFKTFGKEVYVH